MKNPSRQFAYWTLLTVLLMAPPVFATEIYHWVDEDGILNYSQERPAGNVSEVTRMTLEEPVVPEQTEDIYGVEEQAERMARLREDMQERRDAARERREKEASRPVVIVQQPNVYSPNRWWWPPIHPLPPVRPEPPIAVPYSTATLAPLNR